MKHIPHRATWQLCILHLALCIVFSLPVSAQDMVLHYKDGSEQRASVSQLDSISFSETSQTSTGTLTSAGLTTGYLNNNIVVGGTVTNSNVYQYANWTIRRVEMGNYTHLTTSADITMMLISAVVVDADGKVTNIYKVNARSDAYAVDIDVPAGSTVYLDSRSTNAYAYTLSAPATPLEQLTCRVNQLESAIASISSSGTTTTSSGNILAGKKLVVLGDSFTHGDFNSYTDSEGRSGTASSYLYSTDYGCYKTYPYWIAQRNGMTLVNLAQNGATLTNRGTSTDLSTVQLSQIPSDADYILIKIGINDDEKHEGMTVGATTDTNSNTFCGAWNVVLTQLLNNFPFAKIGIIISNGSTTTISDATRQMVQLYGFPYLDYEKDPDVGLLFRTNKTQVGVKPSVITKRAEQYRVSTSNMHPNIEAHKFESTIVEAFLRRL